MRRRKFLIGAGSFAAATAGAIGTGAFTDVTASRTVNIRLTGDSDALLKMVPSSGPNGEYAATTGTNEIKINLNNSDDGGGSGLNKNSETTIGNAVTLENQGTQRVRVYVPWRDAPNNFEMNDRVSADADEDGDREFAKQGESGDTDDGVPNNIYMDVVTPRGGGKSLTGIYGVFDPSDSYFDDMEMDPGSTMGLGLFIRVKNPGDLNATFPITADADLA